MDTETTSPRLSVDVWSDIACPWCSVGERRLAAALERFEHADAVDVTWHSFELDAEAPRVDASGRSYAERLAAKYGATLERARAMIDTMTAAGASEGLDFRFDRIRPGNTFDAHRLLHLAREFGLQEPLKRRLLRAYLGEGVAIGDPAALHALAVEVGLDADRVDALLSGDELGDAVRADEAEALRLGIGGVPFFVVGGRHGLSGAQPPEALLQVLRATWSEGAAAGASGEACGPEGCC